MGNPLPNHQASHSQTASQLANHHYAFHNHANSGGDGVELLIAAIYLVYLGFYSTSPFCQCGLFIIACVCVLGFFADKFLSNHAFKQGLIGLNIGLVAFSAGLLTFNYFPSTSLMLLFLYRWFRLISSTRFPSRNTYIFIALSGVGLFGIGLWLACESAPLAFLSSPQALFLDYLSLVLTALGFAYHVWRLQAEIQQSNQAIDLSHARIQTLVEVTSKLSRFTPPQIWQPIIRSNQPLTITNHRKKLTILFSDIVGFTELSDTLSPAYLADILNTYFGRMTAIANQYGATLDKFIGDGMLCFFGDTPRSDDRENAIQCATMALEMRRTMSELRTQWRLLGFEGLYIRIGINTGECHVGNFGSIDRMSYTLIGKAANLASRLESVAEKDQILLSESTFLLIESHHHCNLVGYYGLKGLSKPIPVWELLEHPVLP